MKEGLLATAGVLSAVAASTCCIVPLLLVSAGVSGAWIGSLTALAPYQPVFVVVAEVACEPQITRQLICLRQAS